MAGVQSIAYGEARNLARLIIYHLMVNKQPGMMSLQRLVCVESNVVYCIVSNDVFHLLQLRDTSLAGASLGFASFSNNGTDVRG